MAENLDIRNMGLDSATIMATVVKEYLDKKVDKTEGKDLSSNDFTAAYKEKLDGIEAGAQVNVEPDSELLANSTNAVQNKVIKAALDNKVSKISGKDLSSNDYTDSDKSKLAGIEAGAQVNPIVDDVLSDNSSNPIQNKAVSQAIGNKADKASPQFTGIPTAPTADSGSSSTQIATTEFVSNAIVNALKNISGVKLIVLDDGKLPDVGEDGGIYLVPLSDKEENNSYAEWVYITDKSKWERIGTTEVDLSNCVKYSDIKEITEEEIRAMFA